MILLNGIEDLIQTFLIRFRLVESQTFFNKNKSLPRSSLSCSHRSIDIESSLISMDSESKNKDFMNIIIIHTIIFNSTNNNISLRSEDNFNLQHKGNVIPNVDSHSFKLLCMYCLSFWLQMNRILSWAIRKRVMYKNNQLH